MNPDRIAVQKKSRIENKAAPIPAKGKVRLEIYGEEVVEKTVRMSGNSGRVYLPMVWVGRRVKIVRLNSKAS
jgi:putative transposon-encoded protein